MTATVKVEIPNLLDGEQGFLLDDIAYVAVSVVVTRDGVNSFLCATAHARLVDKGGQPIHDAHDKPVEAFHPFSCPADSVNDKDIGGQAGMARHAILLVLGDPEALGDMNDNIRHAMRAAAITGPVDISSIDLTETA